MSKPKSRFTAAMQYAGLAAKPSLTRAVASTLTGAYDNVTLALGEVGMVGVKAGAHKVGVVSGRIRRSPAIRDAKELGRKAGPIAATAAAAVAVSAVADLMRSGLNRGVQAAVTARVNGNGNGKVAWSRRTVRPRPAPVKATHRKVS